MQLFFAPDISILFDDLAIAVEGFPVLVCLLIEGSPRSDCPSLVAIQVLLRTEDGTASKCTHWDVWRDSLYLFSIAHRGSLPDYVRQTRRLTIPVCAKDFCYSISAIDNLSVEKHEYFYVTLTHGSNGYLNERINIPTPTKRYEILDEDSKLCSSYWEVSCPSTYVEYYSELGSITKYDSTYYIGMGWYIPRCIGL